MKPLTPAPQKKEARLLVLLNYAGWLDWEIAYPEYHKPIEVEENLPPQLYWVWNDAGIARIIEENMVQNLQELPSAVQLSTAEITVKPPEGPEAT